MAWHQVRRTRFNPRAPCGARRITWSVHMSAPSFQSTRPVWGATYDEEVINLIKNVSIHAPRVGRDPFCHSTPNGTTSFNPRAPCGARHRLYRLRGRPVLVSIHAPRVGRDIMWSDFVRRLSVSIHAPRVGRDQNWYGADYIRDVSIHAPRVGRDCCYSPSYSDSGSFNPRAPCGARRETLSVM